jgi:hypothetical protein
MRVIYGTRCERSTPARPTPRVLTDAHERFHAALARTAAALATMRAQQRRAA